MNMLKRLLFLYIPLIYGYISLISTAIVFFFGHDDFNSNDYKQIDTTTIRTNNTVTDITYHEKK